MIKVSEVKSVPRKKPITTSNVVPVLKKKANLRKKTIKSVTIENTKKVRKIKITTPKTQKTVNEKLLITNNTSPKPVVNTVLNSKVQLALLSPYRFPVPHDKLIGNFARYAGVVFVVIGGFFSLINMNTLDAVYLFSSHDQQALGVTSSVEVTTYSTTYPGTISGVSSGAPGSITSTMTTDTKPKPHLTVEGNISALSNTVPVSVSVPGADEIEVLVYSEHDHAYTTIGNAVRIDDVTWRIYWNTSKFSNGEYKLKVLIKNTYGSYDNSDSAIYSLANVPPSESVSTLLSTSPDTTTGTELVSTSEDDSEDVRSIDSVRTQSVSIVIPSVELKLVKNPLTNEPIQISLLASNHFSEVRLYAKNSKTLVSYYVGKVSLLTNLEATIHWYTKNVVNGSYVIQAYAESDSVEIESLPLSVVVNNTVVEASTDDKVLTETSLEDIQKSEIDISITNGNTLSGKADINFNVHNAESLEVYALPKNSLTPFFLGLAQKVDNEYWKYVWSTPQSPNGSYQVFGKLKNQYGFIESSKLSVNILNNVSPIFTEEQEKTIDVITEVQNKLPREISSTVTIDESISLVQDPSLEQKTVYIESVDSFIQTIDFENEEENQIESLLKEFRLQLNRELNMYSKALRSDDTEQLQRIKGAIENLKSEVIKKIPSSTRKDEMVDKINVYISQVTTGLQQITIDNETILKDRIGDSIMTDSDRDGISDYDEISLYRTNPFAADTDGDSFIDSTEITLGYNPHDSDSEALVSYESPQDTGIVREDLLVVDSIITLTNFENADTSETATPEPKRAIISGKGLPNSFVTIYIYSTPIVVTVKTDNSGEWSYIFDKELEDGNHEVYVGITDNVGRVVAKSNPLQFVKTAEAFTEATDIVPSTIQKSVEPALFSSNSLLLLVASIGIVAIGLVLILLGIHVKDTRRLKDQLSFAHD